MQNARLDEHKLESRLLGEISIGEEIVILLSSKKERMGFGEAS